MCASYTARFGQPGHVYLVPAIPKSITFLGSFANVRLSKRFGFQTLRIFLPAEVKSFSVFSGHVVLSGLVSQYSLERVVLNPNLSTPGHSLIFVLPG